MLGMALYVVPKTSRRQLFSFPLAYVSLVLINMSVFVGDMLLMNGINNGGQDTASTFGHAKLSSPSA